MVHEIRLSCKSFLINKKMESRADYFKNSSEILDRGLKIYNITENDIKRDVQIIKEWLKTQPHLPETPSDHLITMFLLMNKLSIEKSKKNIDMFYTFRSFIPEFFRNCNPKLPHMQYIMDKSYHIPLPKLTKECFRVIVTLNLAVDDPEPYNLQNRIAHSFNIAEVRMQEDYTIGDIYIIDLVNFKTSQLLQMSPSLIKKAAVIGEEVYSNIVKEIHLINYPSFAEPLITAVKKLINPKVAQRFHFHKDADTIKNFVPLNVLPKDYGGEELSLYELNEIWKQKLSDYKERFDFLENVQVDEKLRPTPLTNDDVLGFYGNFKKLEVD